MLWTIPALLMVPWTLGLVSLYVLGGFTKYLLVLSLLPVTVQLIALLVVTARRVRLQMLQESGPTLHVKPRLLPAQRATVPNH